jgi:hypothetical protein
LTYVEERTPGGESGSTMPPSLIALTELLKIETRIIDEKFAKDLATYFKPQTFPFYHRRINKQYKRTIKVIEEEQKTLESCLDDGSVDST